MEEARIPVDAQLRLRARLQQLILSLLAGVVMCGPLVADSRLQSARKHIRSNDESIRADAVLSLAEIDTVDAAALVLRVAHDRSWRVRQAVQTSLRRFRSEQVVEYLADQALRPGRPQMVAAIAYAFGKARHRQAKSVLVELCHNESWTVQRSALVGLGDLGDRSTVGSISSFLTHKEPTLRTIAVDSLAKLGGEEVIDPVITALDDKAWQVRSSAIAALKKFRVKKSIAPLIAQLEKEKGRLAQDSWDALKEITGFTFDFDADVWKAWWERSKEGFRPPPPRRSGATASAGSGSASSQRSASGSRAGSTGTRKRYATPTRSYYGISTASNRILFLLDASRSMADEVDGVVKKKVDKKVRYAHERLARDYKSNVKIEIAKEELIDTISKLDDKTLFNVVAYETNIHPWEKKLVPASTINRNRAIEFIRKQHARGVQSERSSRRRTSSGSGRTNIYDALELAFKSAGIGVYDRHYRSGVDTIFLLSDGTPTTGKIVNTNEILGEIRRMNGLRKVTIHTINIGRNREFLRQLATQNGGNYVDLTPGNSSPW